MTPGLHIVLRYRWTKRMPSPARDATRSLRVLFTHLTCNPAGDDAAASKISCNEQVYINHAIVCILIG